MGEKTGYMPTEDERMHSDMLTGKIKPDPRYAFKYFREQNLSDSVNFDIPKRDKV